MGNAIPATKFDILSHLPPELVLEIISYLSVREVAKCTLVSRKWSHLIAYLTPFWSSAAAKFVGLSKNIISTSIGSFSSPKDYFILAVKHKNTVKSIKLTPTHIRHPIPKELLFTHCLEAKQGSIVQIQKISQTENRKQRCDLVVDKLTRANYSPDGTVSKNVAILTIKNLSHIVWAHVTDTHLYWVNTNGLWSGYDLNSKKTVFNWKNPLLKEGRGVTVGKCNSCSVVVISHWFPTALCSQDYYSTYALQILKLGDRPQSQQNLVQWKVVQKKHNHDFFAHHDSRYWLRQSFVLSNADENQDGVCHSHTLVLQGDCCTMVQALETSTKDLGEIEDNDMGVGFGKPYCINCDHHMLYDEETAVSIRSVSSAVTHSSDEELLGQVFNNRLYVWQLNKFKNQDSQLDRPRSDLKLRSNSSLVRNQTGTCSSIKLVALGHALSIVAYINSSYLMDYTLQIVHTHTGEVLSEFRRIEKFYNWSLCCQIDPFHKFYFMYRDDKWLNDIQCQVPQSPVTTVHNHHGKVHMEAIQLKKTVMQSWRKHWRCAVNYGLRE